MSHSAPAPAGAVYLHIDSLVLHGFPPSEARRVSAAFEKELTRLLTESPLSASSLAPSLTHSFTPSSHWSLITSRSGACGAGAARALHARLRA